MILACLMLISGCAWMPWSPERMVTTQRVAERCTSISNVIGKNYQVSGKLNLLIGGFGGGWSQTGVELSPEAADRQIQMDRLCRAWAVGAITDEKWTDVYVQFALASIAPLARNDTNEARTQLKAAEEFLRTATAELAKFRPESMYKPENVADKLSEAVAQVATSSVTLEDLHKGAEVAVSGTLLTKQQTAVMNALSDVQTRLGKVEGRLGGGPDSVSISPLYRNWQTKGATKVYFALGKSDLSNKSKKALDDLLKGPFPRELRVEVIGYADTTGSVQKSALLSVARAEEVRDYLIFELNVPASYVVALGRQQGVSSFGSPEENRVVTVRVFEEVLSH